MAERLGRGLQNLVRRFESAPDLKAQKALNESSGFFYWIERAESIDFQRRRSNKKTKPQAQAFCALKRPHLRINLLIRSRPQTVNLKPCVSISYTGFCFGCQVNCQVWGQISAFSLLKIGERKTLYLLLLLSIPSARR